MFITLLGGTSTHSQVELPLYSNLQAHFVLYCGPLTIPKPPWQMGFCMWIVLPGGMRRNPKGRNFGAKSIGHATSRGTANELKCHLMGACSLLTRHLVLQM